MPVQAQLRGVGEVRAELDEEGAEVAVHQVEVVLVDHGRGTHDPRVGPTLTVPSLLGAEDRHLLLGLAHEEYAFVLLEPGQEPPGHVVLALTPPECDERHVLFVDEGLDGTHERSADWRHESRRWHGLAAMTSEKADHAELSLQPRNVGIKVEPIDALDLQAHVPVQDFLDTACCWHR